MKESLVNANSSLVFGAFELHLSIDEGIDGEIITESDVHTWVKLGATLANDDAARLCDLTAVQFDAAHFRLRISTVAR